MDTKRLRPGRHQLSRDEVTAHQRERILDAVETVMAAKGYVDTSVADIIKVAGVSRQTFYQLFASKQECFIAGYECRLGRAVEMILDTPSAGPAMQRFTTMLHSYLTIMASNTGVASLYLVGVYSAGPEAIAHRVNMQHQFIRGVADIFGVSSERDLFACRALVAAISTLVTTAVVDDDPQGVLDLEEQLVDVAARLLVP